jgi:hypothetical protein
VGRIRGRVGDCQIGGLSVYYAFPMTTDTSKKKEGNCRPVLPTTSFLTHFQFCNSAILQFFNRKLKIENPTDTSLKKEGNCKAVLPTTSFITHFPFCNSAILQSKIENGKSKILLIPVKKKKATVGP